MKSGETIRMMTFNLRYPADSDGENGWEHRRDLLIDTIRAADPDLLGTQECLASQNDFLRSKLDEYDTVGVCRDDGKRLGEASAIFYKRERFDLSDANTFWLSKTPETVGSKGWDAKLPRVCSWAELNDLASGRRFVIANTHFDHMGVIARSESAHQLRKWIATKNYGLPVILTGDFNADGGSEPYEILRHGGLLDAWRVVHPAPIAEEGTFHGFTGARTRERIDWIFCSLRFDVVSCKVDYTSRNGRYPSDHFPVMAELRLARS